MRTAKEIMGDLSPEQFAMRCTDFKFFAERVIGYEVQPFHMEWINMVRTNRRVALMAPTGFGKTTILGDAYCSWISYMQRGKEMCIVSKSLPQSTKILAKIKDMIEDNEILRELIPKDRPASMWCSATTMELSSKCKIFCRPYSENIKGIHVDYLLGDEVASYDDFDIWYRFVSTRTNAKNGTLVAISTPDNIADLMSELLVNPEYIGKTYDAVIGDMNTGQSIWPAKWSMEKLRRIRNELGIAKFEREYRCNAKAEAENALFPPHLIAECFEPNFKFLSSARDGFTIIGCDFAIASGPRADFDAYVVLNKMGAKCQMLHGETHKGFPIAAKVQRLKEIYSQYRKQMDDMSTIRFVIDPSSVGQAVFEELRAAGLPVEAANFDHISRNQMLINLRQMIENKDLIIPRDPQDPLTITFTDTLIREMISMMETKTKTGITYETKAPHDDTVFALAMAAQGISRQKPFLDMFEY
jgi:hypothetical protein